MQYHPINAGNRMEEKNYFCTHIYHRDHNERLIRAIYVGKVEVDKEILVYPGLLIVVTVM